MTIPLWLDIGGLRVVHACWDASQMEVLRPVLSATGALTVDALRAGTAAGSAVHDAIEVVLKGPEIRLGSGGAFCDPDVLCVGAAPRRPGPVGNLVEPLAPETRPL